MGVAGTVDFPAHMKTTHQDFLNQNGTDLVTTSMVDEMNTALGASGSPYTSKTPYDPSTYITAYLGYLTAFNAEVVNFDPTTYWELVIDQAKDKIDGFMLDTDYIDDDVEAYAALLDDQINNVVLPRFEAGMSDLNAIMSSAYVMGEAFIEAMKIRDVAKYAAELKAKMNIQRNDAIVKTSESILQSEIAVKDLHRVLTHYAIEAYRIGIVAMKEKNDQAISIDVGDKRWPFEVYMYGSNLLASIGGGTYIPNQSVASSPSTAQSAIGGALAGAAVGSQVGGGTGALVGGLIGLGASLF